jgi:hypothetical protein
MWEAHTGYTKFKKKHSEDAHLGRIFDLGVSEGGHNSDLDVCRGVQFWVGGTGVPKGWEPLHYFTHI